MEFATLCLVLALCLISSAFAKDPIYCPMGAVSIEIDSRLTCVCKANYWGVLPTSAKSPAEIQCTACPVGKATTPGEHNHVLASCNTCSVGYYNRSTKDHTPAESCTPCTAGRTSGAPGTVNAGFCYACLPGYQVAASTDGNNPPTCTKCPAGRYQAITNTVNTCSGQCQPGFWNAPGSSDCNQCAKGYTSSVPVDGNWSREQYGCTKCVTGKAKNVIGPQACISCDYPSQVPADDQESCVCAPGYFKRRDTGQCAMCNNSSYKESKGDDSTCTDCSTGNKSPYDGKTKCGCKEGYKNKAGGLCEACPAGQYNSVTGSGECTDCPAGYSTPVNAQTGNTQCTVCAGGYGQDNLGKCSMCPIGSISSPGQDQNDINPCTVCVGDGVMGNSMTTPTNCNRCKAGYKYISDASCTKCETGKYQLNNASVATACTDCDEDSDDNIISSKCGGANRGTCSAGEGSNDGGLTCSRCTADTYQNNEISNAPCTTCPKSDQVPTADNTSCVCSPGFFWDANLSGGTCVGCEAGKYKLGASNDATCTTCSNLVSDCGSAEAGTCVAGAYPNPDPGGNTCLECAANTFKESPGNTLCMPCGNGKKDCGGSERGDCDVGYGTVDNGMTCNACEQSITSYKDLVGNSKCLPCPSHSVGCSAKTSGQCDVGYGGNAGSPNPINLKKGIIGGCVACPQGYYKDKVENTSCKPCTANKDGCGFASVGSCRPGFGSTDDGITCSQCSTGYYKVGSGNTNCLSCSQGVVNCGFNSSGVCARGYGSGDGGRTCYKCASNKYQPSNTGIGNCLLCSLGNLSKNGNACDQCIPGYGYATNDAPLCTKCADGYYNENIIDQSSDDKQCKPCNSNYKGCGGSWSGVCKSGETLSIDGTSCIACPTNTYKSMAGNFACTTCALHSTNCGGASPGVCMAGFGGTADNTNSGGIGCAQCPVGISYKNTIGNAPCTACKENTKLCGFDYAGACLPAYGGDAGSSAGCVACVKGSTYKTNDGNAPCTACAFGTSAVCGGVFSGLCAAGKTSTDHGLTCTDCPTLTYKKDMGNFACTTCGPKMIRCGNTNSGICDKGYFYAGKDTCKPCTKGTYKSTIANEDCQLCPDGTGADNGATSCVTIATTSQNPFVKSAGGVITMIACILGVVCLALFLFRGEAREDALEAAKAAAMMAATREAQLGHSHSSEESALVAATIAASRARAAAENRAQAQKQGRRPTMHEHLHLAHQTLPLGGKTSGGGAGALRGQKQPSMHETSPPATAAAAAAAAAASPVKNPVHSSTVEDPAAAGGKSTEAAVESVLQPYAEEHEEEAVEDAPAATAAVAAASEAHLAHGDVFDEL